MALVVVSDKYCNVITANISFLVILFSFFLIARLASSSPADDTAHPGNYEFRTPRDGDCGELEGLKDPDLKCSYLKSHYPCAPQGYIDYLEIFYCNLAKYPAVVGYAIYALWLLTLFYLLANTASRYFCTSLESLSGVLKLPPTVAGVTLLSLGNGAPDVFSSVVSFAGAGAGDLGLSSVLGGALFVATVVVGAISLIVGPRGIAVDRCGFVRDAAFLAAVLGSLLAILVSGKIGIWGSVAFLCIYIVYVCIVCAPHCCGERKPGDIESPLLNGTEVERLVCMQKEPEEEEEEEDQGEDNDADHVRRYSYWILYVLQMPLYLPRRLTIPDVSEKRWSKPLAVASAALAPLLLAALWNSQSSEMGFQEKLTTYLLGGLVGTLLGIIAMETTENAAPPKKCLLPWLLGGFLMSVIWAYIIASELVALLVSIGQIIGISASVLGLTVLAWGNSLGDLIANVAIAINGGCHGVQIAISGCYAGPIFNTLVGLGLSLVVASWYAHPDPFAVPGDTSLYATMGFLFGALLWAFLVLHCRGMKLDRVLGIGLLGIYLCFLCLRIWQSVGLV